MHLIAGFLFLLYVFAQVVMGAPIRITRNLDNDFDSPVGGGLTITDDIVDFSLLDFHPDFLSVGSSAGSWHSSNKELEHPSTTFPSEFFPSDREFVSVNVDQISDMKEEALPPSGETDLVIRPHTDLVVHSRSIKSLEKASKGMDTAGEVLGKVAKAADAIPEVGEIVGPAVQVVSWCVKLIGKLLNGVAEAERAAAHARGDFTQKVTDETLKEHPGWLVVTVHPKHTIYFQGQENIDWAQKTTSITTKVGVFQFKVYSARAGIFINDGDGGPENWAYSALADKLQAYGSQGHRLVYEGGAPPSGKPKSGSCGFHVYQYQKNEKSSNPTNHYTLVVVIKDAAGIIVGFEGNGDASTAVLVHSQLPQALQITAGPEDKSPLTFTYGKDTWKSDDKDRCKVGSYSSGSRQMDCSFQCTF
ncbi:hypothetical protein F5890DRAFT_296312 [Lentinula detonsa]|uniref:Uncharacterized protein n=1 Tax=Lentinula detonsa TaxID=2804962 RepID=A0AA38PW17_9AGAR|nr:hypothetical protein F5890DRAFT_296312 [Lentinula detonsa]